MMQQSYLFIFLDQWHQPSSTTASKERKLILYAAISTKLYLNFLWTPQKISFCELLIEKIYTACQFLSSEHFINMFICSVQLISYMFIAL